MSKDNKKLKCTIADNDLTRLMEIAGEKAQIIHLDYDEQVARVFVSGLTVDLEFSNIMVGGHK